MASASSELTHPPRPIVLVALAYLAGVALGVSWPLEPVWLAGGVALCLGPSAWGFWRSRRIHGPPLPTGLLLLVALGLAGWWQGGRVTRQDEWARAELALWPPGEVVGVEGKVDGEPRLRADGVRVRLREVTIQSLRVGGRSGAVDLKIDVFLEGEVGRKLAALPAALPLPGQGVRVWGKFSPIARQTTPGAFDPERYAQSQGIGARVSVYKPACLELGPRPDGIGAELLTGLRQMRRLIGGVFDGRLPARLAPMARALFLGEADLLSPRERDDYAKTGLAHLLAVSGMNTLYVMAVVLVLARLLGFSNRLSAVAGMGGIVFYTALTGFEPPVLRAMIMGLFLLGGFTLRRVSTSLASLALAAFLTLLWDPRNLLRVDWQLSYSCVLSVILLASPLYDLLTPKEQHTLVAGNDPKPRDWSWLRRLTNQLFLLPLATTVAVMLGLLPIQTAYFRQYNLLTPLINIVGVACSVWAMVGVLALAMVGWIPGVGWLAALAAQGALGLFTWFAHEAAGLMGFIVFPRPLPWPLLGVYYAILLGGSWLRMGQPPELRLTRRQGGDMAMALLLSVAASLGLTLSLVLPYLGLAWLAERASGTGNPSGARLGRSRLFVILLTLGLIVAILVWLPLLRPRPAPQVEDTIAAGLDLYMLDVGQGDSLVLRFPNEKIMVVDAGAGDPADQGRLKVGPFLRTLGARQIDCLVATHADFDHIGGMPYLLENFNVGLLLEGPDVGGSEAFKQMNRLERRRKIPEQRASAGDIVRGFDPVRVKLLGPVRGFQDNNASVVMLVQYGEVDLLLAGDLESPGESRLLADEYGIKKRGQSGIFEKIAVPDIEVLKLGHHGSRSSTSEKLLEAFRPEVGLVSVGKRNRYGHPSPEIIARLVVHGVHPYRTDELGTVWVRTDGRRIQIYRFMGS